ELDALLLVPLSAHALFARPLVLGPTSIITVELIHASPVHGVVWCDGSRSVELRVGMEIEIGRGQHRLRLARLSQSPFTNRLVNKFQLPVDGWRGSADRDRRRVPAEVAVDPRPLRP
ncbi:MAG TPA: NAD(+) kinase, partial [Microlunatus sp.]|nr:NAD(+) kinase [Microlunatus sp.]